MHVPPMVSGAGARGSLESPTPESRESTPASPPYPKPGHGLMARLPADEEDIEWLVDNNDFEAFNHVVYDDQGGDGQVV
jgi:succinate--hydroxymethylglutarate CoA-transferase